MDPMKQQAENNGIFSLLLAAAFSGPAHLLLPSSSLWLQAGAARGVETCIYVAPAAETAISPREAALLAPVAEAIAAAAPAAEAGAARRATAALAPVPEIVAPVPATEVAQTGIAAGLAAGALFAPAAEPAAAAGGAFAPVPEIVAAVPAPEVAQTGIQAGFAEGQGQGGSRKLQQARRKCGLGGPAAAGRLPACCICAGWAGPGQQA